MKSYDHTLRMIIEPLLSKPEYLSIEVERGMHSQRINVMVYGEDQAFVIGREARMIKAIQTVMNHIAQRNGDAIQICVLDPQQGGAHVWREFKPDLAWNEDKDLELIRTVAPILEAVASGETTILVHSDDRKTELEFQVSEALALNLISALDTIVRSIGKARQREVQFQPRVQ